MKEFLRFEEDRDSRLRRKTKVLFVFSKHSADFLGTIQWETGWRQYVFHPHESSIWSCGCLAQLGEYVKKLNEEHKRLKEESR